MPKFVRQPQSRSYWARELLLTILATSISIVLTFGTAYYLEYHQKMNSRRQMAMMIIHDIDSSIKQMEMVDSVIGEFSDIQLQVLEGNFKDDIRFAPVFLSLRDPIGIEFHETTERIFTSNVDTWSTIGKVDFIDNVSHCYLLRNQFKRNVVEAFHKIIRPDDLDFTVKSLDDYLDVDVGYYLAETKSTISEMKSGNELNKKMMGITDEDMEKFVENQLQNTKAQLEQMEKVDSAITTDFLLMDERKRVARENFNKNRDKMYPPKGSAGNKSK